MRDEQETATQVLHRLTSYEPGREWTEPVDDPRILQDFESNVVERRPFSAKRYADGLTRVMLPRELPVGRADAIAVLAGWDLGVEPAGSLDLAGLGRLLFLTAGVVRTTERPSGTYLLRAAGSAGARFPLELYVSVPKGLGLPAGVHWYDPVDHALVLVGPAPRSGGAPTVVMTGIPWRTGWRYAERGYRHVFWDAGTALSQLLALADSVGCAPRLYPRFPDAAVSELVGADGVHEWPVALVTLGAGAPSISATGAAVSGVIDSDPLEFPAVTAAQRAGDVDTLGAPWPVADAVEVIPEGESLTLDDVIIKRGSQRRMDPTRGLPLETLRTSMTLAMRGIDLEHWVAVHDVAGLEPGLYRWPHLDTPIRRESPTALRAELYRVCLDQTLARDAAFVVIAATDITQLSDREYREAQLTAGLVEGRLHLAAYALEAGATGMTFLDSEIPALLSAATPAPEPKALSGLIFTCVGVPDNTSKPAGKPGAPVSVRLVHPRD